jgi:hypothetical protein
MKAKKISLLVLAATLSATFVGSTMVSHADSKSKPGVVKPAVVKFVVTFSANGGTGSQRKFSVITGATFTLPAPDLVAPAGKQFSSWNINPAGTGTSYAPGAKIVVTTNITLYAKWVLSPVPTCKPEKGKPAYPPKPCKK